MNTTTHLPSGTWTLDPSATTITVWAKKLGIFTVPATLTVVAGTIEVSDDHEVTKVHVVADASSYASKNAKRNEHVVGADFLDASAHPTIEFHSDQVTSSGTGGASNGTVTIKGQSSPVEVIVSDVAIGDTTGAFVATAAVDRFSIGVDKMPAMVIGANLDVTVNATVVRIP